MANPLAGLRVLVTRPAGQADQLMALIAAAGGQAWHCPAMVISGIDGQ